MFEVRIIFVYLLEIGNDDVFICCLTMCSKETSYPCVHTSWRSAEFADARSASDLSPNKFDECYMF